MEHAWLIADERATEFQGERQSFVTLLDAAMDADHRAVLNHRIETKFAHASLLAVSSFSPDKDRAKAARLLADTYLNSCLSLLLGG